MLVQSPQRLQSNIFYYRQTLCFAPKNPLSQMSFYVEITIKHYFFRHFTGLLIGPDTLLVWYFLDKNKLFDHSRSRLNKIPKFSSNTFPKYWYFDFYQIECYASPSKWLISLTMQWFCDKTKVTRFNERRHSFCCLDFPVQISTHTVQSWARAWQYLSLHFFPPAMRLKRTHSLKGIAEQMRTYLSTFI